MSPASPQLKFSRWGAPAKPGAEGEQQPFQQIDGGSDRAKPFWMGRSVATMLLDPSHQRTALDVLLMLVMGHCLGDFGLQSDRMAIEKCPGRDATLPWIWWLGSHAGIHGFLVGAITGVPLLGLAEWIVHSLIDYGKCHSLYRLRGDQLLHIACKLAWTAIWVKL